jgi:2-dehydro-3-deoxyphosphogluconate aldolase / (4S)-4-hydroxy-2-oxoglutarate aldolase
MTRIWEPVAAVVEQRVLAIVRKSDPAAAHTAATDLLDAGVRAVEISLTTPSALDVIGDIEPPDGTFLGAGTVLDAATAVAAVRAGASFLVTPTLDPQVIAAGRRYGVPVVPGVATPTEALRALAAGADLVKLFPASAWAPGVLRDVLAALPQLSLVPTGGVGLADAPDYLAAGAVAVGLGSALSAGAGPLQEQVTALLGRLAAAR